MVVAPSITDQSIKEYEHTEPIVKFSTFSANASPTSLASPVKLLEIITALRPRLSVFDAIFPRASWLFPTIILAIFPKCFTVFFCLSVVLSSNVFKHLKEYLYYTSWWFFLPLEGYPDLELWVHWLWGVLGPPLCSRGWELQCEQAQLQQTRMRSTVRAGSAAADRPPPFTADSLFLTVFSSLISAPALLRYLITLNFSWSGGITALSFYT